MMWDLWIEFNVEKKSCVFEIKDLRNISGVKKSYMIENSRIRYEFIGDSSCRETE